MNKQPFYHRAEEFLFTATRCVGEDELLKALNKWTESREAKKLNIVPGTIQFGAYDDEPEPGDPADLMGDVHEEDEDEEEEHEESMTVVYLNNEDGKIIKTFKDPPFIPDAEEAVYIATKKSGRSYRVVERYFNSIQNKVELFCVKTLFFR